MEMKPGYKQTEVGVIPEDWDTEYIEDIAHIATGSKNTQDRVSDGRYPFFVRSQTVERINSYSYDGEAVLTAGDGVGTGKIYHYIRGKFDVHQRVYRISDFSPRVTGFYFYLQFSSRFYNRIMQMTAKSSVDSVRREMIARMQIPLPPTRAEQTAIATALSDVDALLDGLDRLIAKKRDLKQAAMQQLLTGDTRLPGFEGEWEDKRIGELLTIRHGKSQREVEVSDGLYPILATGGQIGTARSFLCNKPSVLIGRKGTINKPQYMDTPFWSVDTLFYSDIHGDNCAKFLYYRFCLIDWMEYNEASGVPSLNAGTIENISLLFPDSDEQHEIATVLSDMDAEIEAIEQRRAKTADLKQAMMQELLTGKTRLVEPQMSSDQVDSASSNARVHNWSINEAVVISTLVKHFGRENYPLGRKRYTKLSYLLHRHVERQAEGYIKKAAGPYNPQTKYGGPEKIAMQNRYIQKHKGPKGHSGFIAADNIVQAEGYFEKWYGPEAIQWLEQFRFRKNDELEVLATVDMAAEELRASGKGVDVAAVKNLIGSYPEWEAKLDRAVFSDANIAEAIKQCEALMRSETVKPISKGKSFS